MKKLTSSLRNMVVVLLLITVASGAVLAYVNRVTASQIARINAANLEAGIRKVMANDRIQVSEPDTLQTQLNGKEKTFVAYTVSDADGQLLGRAVQSSENGFGGELRVLVGFDAEGTVLGYTLLQHSETPGLGAKAALWFQKDGGEKRSIVGKNPGKTHFTVSKDGGDIDAITASTITSRAFLRAVQNAYDQFYK